MHLKRRAFYILLPLIVAFSHGSENEEGSSPLLGTTHTALIAQLGEPMGSLSFDQETVLIYPTQRITLANGKVTNVQNRPDAQIETPEERDARIAAKRAEIGEELLEKMKYEPTLLKMSPTEQLRHWGRFKNQFPETDVDSEMEKARLRLEEDLQQEHIIIKENRPTIYPLRNLTDPFYRSRRGFYSPDDPRYNRATVVIPNPNRRYRHRKAVDQEPYIIDQLPDRLPHDEVFNTPKGVAPILSPQN